jgi:transcriptional regulator with XRE-family HTH domain
MGQRRRSITIANSSILPRLSRQLLRVLAARNLSIQQFAAMTGMSPSFLRAVARAEQNLSVLAMEEIAHALDLSIEDLLMHRPMPEPDGALPVLKAGRRRGSSTH